MYKMFLGLVLLLAAIIGGYFLGKRLFSKPLELPSVEEVQTTPTPDEIFEEIKPYPTSEEIFAKEAENAAAAEKAVNDLFCSRLDQKFSARFCDGKKTFPEVISEDYEARTTHSASKSLLDAFDAAQPTKTKKKPAKRKTSPKTKAKTKKAKR